MIAGASSVSSPRTAAATIARLVPSICVAEFEAIRVAWAGRLDGYAKAAAPVTSAKV